MFSERKADAAQCRAWYEVCAGHGRVARMRYAGTYIYDEPCDVCCALCRNRERYHEVEGVTSGCTGAARSYCDVGSRGGLSDATWGTCTP